MIVQKRPSLSNTRYLHITAAPPSCYSIRFVFHRGLLACVGEINLRIFHDNCGHLPVCARDRIVSRLFCVRYNTDGSFVITTGLEISFSVATIIFVSFPSVPTSARETVYLMSLRDDFDRHAMLVYARVNETDVL